MMKKIRRYCVPNGLLPKLFLLLMLLIGGVLLWLAYATYTGEIHGDFSEVIVSLVLGVIAICCGIGIYKKLYRNKRRGFDQRWTFLQSQGLSHFIEHDFNKGSRLFNGRLIVGGRCMLGKNTGLIVFFKEISVIRRHCHTKNYSSGSVVRVGTIEIEAGGKEYVICNLKKFEEQSQDWYSLCTYLANNAPNIFIDLNVKQTSEYIDNSSSDD